MNNKKVSREEFEKLMKKVDTLVGIMNQCRSNIDSYKGRLETVEDFCDSLKDKDILNYSLVIPSNNNDSEEEENGVPDEDFNCLKNERAKNSEEIEHIDS